MQTQNLTALIHDIFDNEFASPKDVAKKMDNLALKNQQDLSRKIVPDYLRLPTPDELSAMRTWAIDYRKRNRQHSKRQVRKAIQQHFQIRIYK